MRKCHYSERLLAIVARATQDEAMRLEAIDCIRYAETLLDHWIEVNDWALREFWHILADSLIVVDENGQQPDGFMNGSAIMKAAESGQVIDYMGQHGLVTEIRVKLRSDSVERKMLSLRSETARRTAMILAIGDGDEKIRPHIDEVSIIFLNG